MQFFVYFLFQFFLLATITISINYKSEFYEYTGKCDKLDANCIHTADISFMNLIKKKTYYKAYSNLSQYFSEYQKYFKSKLELRETIDMGLGVFAKKLIKN